MSGGDENRTVGKVGQTRRVHARSALFDVYGDHLLDRGGVAPVAALIRLLRPLGIRPPAVRTAVSRMVGQGWLVPDETSAGPGYALTDRAAARLQHAGDRVYRRTERSWDGRWHVDVLTPVRDRTRRDRLRNQLRFYGLAPVMDNTWVSPHPATEARRLIDEEGLCAVRLSTADIEPTDRLLEAFDVAGLGRQYDAWLTRARAEVRDADEQTDDEAAFVARTDLVHGWRKFLFIDPDLPAELLPDSWPGEVAATYFTEQAERLLPAASRFVDACLVPESSTRKSGASR